MGSSPEPDSLRELVDSGFRPPLAWIVRWSDGGRVDALHGAWAASEDGHLMEATWRRSFDPWTRSLATRGVVEEIGAALRQRREELRGFVRVREGEGLGRRFVLYTLRVGAQEWRCEVDTCPGRGDYGRMAEECYAIDQVVAAALRVEHPAIVRRFVPDPPRLADVLDVDLPRAAR